MSAADEHKEAGNKAFAAKDFDEAIKCYTKAIQADPQNHVYFSNRSASHASKGQWQDAISDAKQCIKLDPAFIKGYYRLSTAQIESNDLDGANTTVKQGLNIEPGNKQLEKLARSVKTKKSSERMRVNQKATAAAAAVVGGADSSISKEMMDLQMQLRSTHKDHSIVQASILAAEKNLKRNEITVKELEGVPVEEERKMYMGIGKMFMMQTRDDIFDCLQKEMKDDEKKMEDMVQKKDYLERRMKSQQQNIIELSRTK